MFKQFLPNKRNKFELVPLKEFGPTNKQSHPKDGKVYRDTTIEKKTKKPRFDFCTGFFLFFSTSLLVASVMFGFSMIYIKDNEVGFYNSSEGYLTPGFHFKPFWDKQQLHIVQTKNFIHTTVAIKNGFLNITIETDVNDLNRFINVLKNNSLDSCTNQTINIVQEKFLSNKFDIYKGSSNNNTEDFVFDEFSGSFIDENCSMWILNVYTSFDSYKTLLNIPPSTTTTNPVTEFTTTTTTKSVTESTTTTTNPVTEFTTTTTTTNPVTEFTTTTTTTNPVTESTTTTTNPVTEFTTTTTFVTESTTILKPDEETEEIEDYSGNN